jgi:hypothetical protein
MRPLSSDLREFIHLLNTNSVKYVIVGAWARAFHGRPRYTGRSRSILRSSGGTTMASWGEAAQDIPLN